MLVERKVSPLDQRVQQRQIKHPVYCCVCGPAYSQEDACSHEQEERVLHQVGVSARQHRQVRITVFQFFHPALPRLEHVFERAEGAAGRGGRDAGDRRKTAHLFGACSHLTSQQAGSDRAFVDMLKALAELS